MLFRIEYFQCTFLSSKCLNSKIYIFINCYFSRRPTPCYRLKHPANKLMVFFAADCNSKIVTIAKCRIRCQQRFSIIVISINIYICTIQNLRRFKEQAFRCIFFTDSGWNRQIILIKSESGCCVCKCIRSRFTVRFYQAVFILFRQMCQCSPGNTRERQIPGLCRHRCVCDQISVFLCQDIIGFIQSTWIISIYIVDFRRI